MPDLEWFIPGSGCGAGGNESIDEDQMAEIVTFYGEHFWLVAHTVDQALAAISETGLENNLPMDAVRLEDKHTRKNQTQIWPSMIKEVIQPKRLSRKWPLPGQW